MNKLLKNNRRRIISILSVIAILIATFFYLINQSQKAAEQEKIREQLQSDISTQVSLHKSGEISIIDLSKLTSFAWDKLFIFGPYVPLDIIQKRLDSSWRPSTSLLIGSDTPFTLLVFMQNNEVVQYIEYPLELGNFSEAGERIEGYKPNEAIFVMNDHGYILWFKQ